jgi:Uma2 family endonuclease
MIAISQSEKPSPAKTAYRLAEVLHSRWYIERMTHAKNRTKTYADYAKLPEGAPYQLIHGQFVKSPSPTLTHQEIVKRLFQGVYALELKRKGTALFAPLDVFLSDTDVYQPDIIFISTSRQHILSTQKIEGAPDLVMEVLSPSTAKYDLNQKCETYFAACVREYWIVDPRDRSVRVLIHEDEEFVPADTTIGRETRSVLYPELSYWEESIFGL